MKRVKDALKVLCILIAVAFILSIAPTTIWSQSVANAGSSDAKDDSPHNNTEFIDRTGGTKSSKTAVERLVKIAFLAEEIDRDFVFPFCYENNTEQFNEIEGRLETVENGLDTLRFDIENLKMNKIPILPGNIVSIPEPTSLMYINFETHGQELPTDKKTTIYGTLQIVSDGAFFECWSRLKVQGGSSAKRDKKNWAFECYKDSTKAERIYLKTGNWAVSNDKSVSKAEWNDCSFIRNTILGLIWGDMVNSRSGWPKNEVETPLVGNHDTSGWFSGATGHTEGFPAVQFINGEFYGLSTWYRWKDTANYNLDPSNPKHYQLDTSNHTPWWEITTEDFKTRSPEVWGPEHEEDLNRFKKYAGKTGWAFRQTFEEAFDTQNAIDYFIFLQFCHLTDNREKNTQIISYDGQKWFFLPYDLDASLGISWDGKGEIRSPKSILISKTSDRFWGKVYRAFPKDIENRYAELRDKNILSIDNIYKHVTERASRFTPRLLAAEYEKWPDKPNNVSHAQTLAWIRDHIPYLDTWFNYNPDN